jgi:exodeoxyribonuclease-3
MIRIVTLNLNGIRSATRKGWLEWLAAQQADVVCVQELKAQDADLDESLRCIDGMQGYFHFAEKKGYSGVGVYTRQQPQSVVTGFGNTEFDAEGRYVQADIGDLSVISLYLPSGSSSEERQAAKFRFLDAFLPQLQALKASGREIVLCGDLNIAHKEIDLRNWRSNQKNSGFLPEERAWLTRVLDEVGYVDVFRGLDARPEQYTWWSNRGQAWAKNVGWRLDYQLASPAMAALARQVRIYKEQRFSDHAPVTVDYDWG